MRILFVAQSANPTGASLSMLDLIRGDIEQGHEASVVLPEGGAMESLLDRHCIPFIKVRSRPWIGTSSTFRYWRRWLQINSAARAAVRHLAGERLDLVYTNTITSPMGAFIARDLGLPNVWQIRENMPSGDEAGPRGGYERARRLFSDL